MTKDNAMEDTSLYKYLVGLLMLMGSLLFGWTHQRASSAHNKIDAERKDNENRFNICYDTIAKQSENLGKCRQEIDNKIDRHMTEQQVKDFVDRSIRPVEKSIAAMHDDIKIIMNDRRGQG